MTHQSPPTPAPPGADPGRQIASLREALALVRGISGNEGASRSAEDALDEAARFSSAYDRALPIVRRRFDALAGEMAAWAAAGVEALLAAGRTPPPAPAAKLAAALEDGLATLRRMMGVS